MKRIARCSGEGTGTAAHVALAVILASGCASRDPQVLEPTTTRVTSSFDIDDWEEIDAPDEIVVYDQAEVTISHSPVETQDASQQDALAALLASMKDEANRRAEAASEAVLSVGPDLMQNDDWEAMVRGLVDLLSSPTVVIVQLPSGSFKKVKLEDLATLDVAHSQVFTIKSQVGAKMKAALSAQMQSHGVASPDAKKLSGIMMQTYLSSL